MKSSVEFECKLDLRWSQIYSFVRWLLLDPRPDLAGIDFTTSISISSPAASFFAIHSSLSQCDVLYKNVMRLLVCLLCPRFQKWDRCLSLKCLLDIPTTAAKIGFESRTGYMQKYTLAASTFLYQYSASERNMDFKVGVNVCPSTIHEKFWP